MNEVTRNEIFNAMHALKLTGMIEAYDDVLSDTLKRKAPASYLFSPTVFWSGLKLNNSDFCS